MIKVIKLILSRYVKKSKALLLLVNVYLNYLKSSSVSNKIIVIESDDWGGIRMPSKAIFNELINQGIDVKSNPFNHYDSLENDEDLELLLALCDRIEKKFQKKIKITLNYIIGNPDFEKIEASNFSNYYYETFDQTYQKSSSSQSVLKLIKKGIEAGFFKPQFHGREHVDFSLWLELLKNNNSQVRAAFQNRTFALTINNINPPINLWQAYNYKNEEDLASKKQAISEGLSIFKQLFGFNSKSTIAPSGVWNKEIEDRFFLDEVQYLQTFAIQKSSEPERKSRKSIFHFTGQKNKNTQSYLVRNCFFEPSTNKNIDWLNNCYRQISFAFLFNKPAIICMHRINFSGAIDSARREESLKKFETLLSKIMTKWPNVQFLSSDELGDFINK